MAFQPSGPPPSISLGGPAPAPAASGGSDGPDSASVAANLLKAEKALQAALSGEQDAQDRAVISGLINKIHTIEAGRQKEKDAAMGISPQLKFVRRQSQSQGQGGGY